MHRIPFGKDGPSENRPAVYLQHGILSSSADWILKPDTGLGYILADAGYDVWMPNVRGTRYSRKHVTLDPDSDAKKFWSFTWHDIGVDDVPSMIDYVIDAVKQEQIFYIGHSQGTTVFYVMCSERPEYNKKIRAMFSFAPVAYMKHMTSPLMRIIAMADWIVGVSAILFKKKYDYGFFGNLNKYRSPFPPKYNLKNVKAPVYLHYSRNDWLSNEKDVIRLYRELGNPIGKFRVLDDKFNHIDYIYGIDAYELLYVRVLGLMKRH
ncbi:hypothetical protein RI129_007104 [Pyrocoelia pectoralis]|uniref:AB hydrolase-1 domain-containing protein n=1 Tax=Pyrocoelia pectoralis TaxID=417401 RepID=A0AAN7VFY9_9COLE